MVKESYMFGLFKKKKADHNIYAPVNGRSMELENVKDEVFSSKMLGDGIAFTPDENTVYIPCQGTITTIADTKHAFGIQMENGAEVLVHVGLDTVNLNGEGFEVLKKVNDKVTPGDEVLKIDLDVMKEHDIDLTTMLILSNDNGCKYKIEDSGKDVKAGTDVVITAL